MTHSKESRKVSGGANLVHGSLMPPNLKLKRLREDRRLSQSELSHLTGISQPNLSAIESGTRAIGKERAIVLAKALRVHPAEILFSDFDVSEVGLN